MTAEDVRRHFLEIIAPALEREHLEQEPAAPDAWYFGTCDSVCQTLEAELGGALAPFTGAWGSFTYAAGRAEGHYFLYDQADTIVDPTSAQYDLEPCAIIRRGDPLFERYHVDP